MQYSELVLTCDFCGALSNYRIPVADEPGVKSAYVKSAYQKSLLAGWRKTKDGKDMCSNCVWAPTAPLIFSDLGAGA